MKPTAPDAQANQPPSTRGRTVGWVALVVLAASAVLASNVFSIRDSLLGSALPAAEVPATSRILDSSTRGPTPERTATRSAPWWQIVTELEGTGSTTSVPFTIDARAVDWRVTWSCEAGHLDVRASGHTRPLVDADCPEGVGHADRAGSTRLEVTAGGPWRLQVEQRIEIPLVEPLLATMTAPGTATLAVGSFYKVDKVGAGKVRIFEAEDGFSVRLDDFWVTPKTSLQLRLSTAESPRTSQEYLSSRSQLLAVLDVTSGSLNYVAPVGVDPEGFRSVVIWSPSDNSAYAAARLEPPT
ncbi:MAG: hypothetical protein ACRD1K_13255 [Acidimicrobiales bacterium]